MSSDQLIRNVQILVGGLNPFGTGQCLPTYEELCSENLYNESQSLWNRAVSSDFAVRMGAGVHLASQSLWNRAVSSDAYVHFKYDVPESLNPFGTGQCLPTAVVF